SARHTFPERILVVHGTTGLPEKTARIYETAQATITVDKERSERTLRATRKLIIAQRYKDQFLVYSPRGALYRGEQDLTSEHFDTLSLTGLLPGKTLRVGETWKPSNPAVQALCSFEGLTENKLTGKLEKVVGTTATFSVSGTTAGVEHGALV